MFWSFHKALVFFTSHKLTKFFRSSIGFDAKKADPSKVSLSIVVRDVLEHLRLVVLLRSFRSVVAAVAARSSWATVIAAWASVTVTTWSAVVAAVVVTTWTTVSA